jgi:hypothetical protein
VAAFVPRLERPQSRRCMELQVSLRDAGVNCSSAASGELWAFGGKSTSQPCGTATMQSLIICIWKWPTSHTQSDGLPMGHIHAGRHPGRTMARPSPTVCHEELRAVPLTHVVALYRRRTLHTMYSCVSCSEAKLIALSASKMKTFCRRF